MEKVWSFGATKPKQPMAYATPEPPTRVGLLVWAGSSSWGSHTAGSARKCLRAFALGGGHGGTPSRKDGSVQMIGDPSGGLITGPVAQDLQESIRSRALSVYMLRGTLIHVALAHALARRALERDGTVIVAGHLVRADHLAQAGMDFYTAAEAIEAAAELIGHPCHHYSLPAARRMLAQVERWAEELIKTEEVLGIETQLEWHLRAPWTYTARYDLLSRNRLSRLIRATDYKTGLELVKARYVGSAQLMGQDQMGLLWAKSKWAGVRVLWCEDNKDVEVGRMETWDFARAPVMPDLERAVCEAQEAVIPYIGRPAGEWPANPFMCGDCRHRTEGCWGR